MAASIRMLRRVAFTSPSTASSRLDNTSRKAYVSRAVNTGDYVSMHYTGSLDDGEVFETTREDGKQPYQFEVGSGKMIKGVEAMVLGMSIGDAKKERLSPEDAYGQPNEELIATFPTKDAPQGLEKGVVVRLSNGLQATVVECTDSSITVDANPRLAGKHVTFDIEVTDILAADQLEKITFGAGCFWGPELAFQRVPGVVGTEVGYSNGQTQEPTYEQVCSGQTGHSEVVQVTYSKAEVTPWDLCETMYDSLKDPTQVNGQGYDQGTQYRTGIYYQTDEQRDVAEKFLAKKQAELTTGELGIEIEKMDNYWAAEEYHQQYLSKGGRNGNAQSPAKGCNDPIRCYG